MSDTRAVASLPSLNIEIRHREVPEENAEYISITLKATPDLASFAGLLDPLRLMGRPDFDPWQAWLRLADPFGFWRSAAALPPPPGPRAE